MSRRPIMAGNWKMHLTVAEATALASEIRNRCARFRDVDVVVAPTALCLVPVRARLTDSPIRVAAQNCYSEVQGAFTGELSPMHLADAGISHVILGHSERRQFFGETDEGVAKKARAVFDQGMIPIVCVGESLAERDANQTLSRVERQVKAGLAQLSADEVALTVVAYEPIWAIGTGRTATPAQAQEVHAAIRGILTGLHGAAVAERVRIQYGGSVKPDNIQALMAQPDIDGALVGGASLTADSFARIVAFREEP